MRDTFDLCCKVVGLVVFCMGLYVTLNTIPVFVGAKVNPEKLWGQTIWRTLEPAMQADMKKSTTYIWLLPINNIEQALESKGVKS